MVFRAFIAVDIPVPEPVLQFHDELARTGARLKLVEPENIHLTLKFLGNTDEELVPTIRRVMEESVVDLEPFTIQLKGCGVFPKWNYIKVVWVGMEGAERLVEVAKRLNRGLKPHGFKPERSFKPHLTLARVKSRKGKKRIQRLVSDFKTTVFGEWPVHRIRLKKSVLGPGGPTYSTVEEVELRRAGDGGNDGDDTGDDAADDAADDAPADRDTGTDTDTATDTDTNAVAHPEMDVEPPTEADEPTDE